MVASAIFREGLAGVLAYQDDFDVVGGASTRRRHWPRSPRSIRTSWLMDIDRPGDDGIATTRRAKSDSPDVTVRRARGA